MNENEIMNLVAEEGFIKSPKKVREKATSTIDQYIEEFDEIINKIRMKHDKSLPVARSMGTAVSDDVINKSKKDLEKILRRYRVLTIEKLEDLKEQIEEIKNPLKAEDQGKAILDRADEIHDERFAEIKEFYDTYKPVWVKELATEGVDDSSAEEVTENGFSISEEQVQKLGDRIAAIKQAKPDFEKAKTNVLADIKTKFSKAADERTLNGYMEAINKAKSRTGSIRNGEDWNKVQAGIKNMRQSFNALTDYKKDAISSISDIIISLSYKEYIRSRKNTTSTEESTGGKSPEPLNRKDAASWIRSKVNECLKEKNLPSISEYVTELEKMRDSVKNAWINEGGYEADRINKRDRQREVSEEKKAEKKKRSELVKNRIEATGSDPRNAKSPSQKKKMNYQMTQKAMDKYSELKRKCDAGEISSDEMSKQYMEYVRMLKGAAFASYTGASESMTVGETAFFIGGMVIGQLLYKGLIAKREDVSDKAIPGAKAYRYLLNDEFLKAEKDLKKLVSSKKTFEVNRTVAKEILAFKNEYYRPVAYTINKFLDFYDKAKPDLFKEKKYYFDSPNTVRDEAIYKKITLWRTELYAAGAANEMDSKAMEVGKYTPAYDLGTDCETIRVDAKFLNDILNVDKTFAILKEIEKALGDLPDPLEIHLYNVHNRALSQYHLPVNTKATCIDEASSPLHAYIMYEYVVAEKMKRLRDMFIHYISVVYDILNYTRYIDNK